MIAPRLRFAPSPTGSLHLGNARTALFNWLLARAKGGVFVLRIEDTDSDREQAGSEAEILLDLRWLGLTWDEGPDTGGAYGPYRQSERQHSYVEAADRLLAAGAAFRCFCGTVADHAAHVVAGGAAGHRDPCRAIEDSESARRAAAGEAFALRFRVPISGGAGLGSLTFNDRLHGAVVVPLPQVPDAVLLRRDGRPTYNFAVVVDDAAMRINLVLRGDDHLSNTPLQVLLYRALGAPIPNFAHVPMVLGPDGERLSKRHGATSVGAWRARGVPPEALVNGLALLGWAPSRDRTIVSLGEMAAEFDLAHVGRSAAIFDPVKLDWISAQHVHAMSPERLAAEVACALVGASRLDPASASASAPWIASVAEFLRPALGRFDQVDAQVEPVFHPGGPLSEDDRALLAAPQARTVLRALADRLESGAGGDSAGWTALRGQLAAASGATGKALFQPVRVALTGRGHGRELDRLWPLITEGARVLPAIVPSARSRVATTLEAIR
jgi:glutamyl-tRNA synthetase/nondiscriminating glutamyl-tRNA synthetase